MLGALSETLYVNAWYRLRRFTRRHRTAEARKAFEAAVSRLGPDDICIDCGANLGLITTRLAETGATVHAFEPNPTAFQALSRALGKRQNVVLHNAALGIGNGTTRLYLSPKETDCLASSQHSSIVPFKRNIAHDKFIDVTKIDFVDFTRSLKRPVSVVKMDIEGAEVSILAAIFEQRLHEHIRLMFVETHEKQIPQLRSETMAMIRKSRNVGNINCDWW